MTPRSNKYIEELSDAELRLALHILMRGAYASLSYEEKALLIDIAKELKHRHPDLQII